MKIEHSAEFEREWDEWLASQEGQAFTRKPKRFDAPDWLPMMPDGHIDWRSLQVRAVRRGILPHDFWDMTPAEVQMAVELLNKDKPSPELARRIEEVADILLSPQPARPGPKPGNRAERIEARLRWEAIKHSGEMTLEQWLERQYGAHPNGDLVVPRSTFYSWPKP